jgi:hypothetical protein
VVGDVLGDARLLLEEVGPDPEVLLEDRDDGAEPLRGLDRKRVGRVGDEPEHLLDAATARPHPGSRRRPGEAVDAEMSSCSSPSRAALVEVALDPRDQLLRRALACLLEQLEDPTTVCRVERDRTASAIASS